MLYGEFCMLDYIKEYINNNFKSIVLIFSCLIIGLVIGIITFNFMTSGTKTEIIQTLNNTLSSTKSENFEGINVIKNGMISNGILVLILYFSSITLIAPGLVCMTNIFKGFSIGIYIPTLFYVFGFGNGIIALLLLVIIPNLIYIPAFIYLSINSVSFHYELIEAKENGGGIKITIKEMYKLILGFSVIALSVIIEQLLSLGVIHMYIKM